MRDETAYWGHNLAILTVAVTTAGMALQTFSAHWAAWAVLGVFGFCWLTAILGLADGASRGFLAGTLRKSTYTQIYTALRSDNGVRHGPRTSGGTMAHSSQAASTRPWCAATA